MNTNIERPKASKPRIRHTMIRVKDLEHSIKFYTEVLGMQVFRRSDNEGGKYTVVFMGFGDENEDPAIELTYNWDPEEYDGGRNFGHLAYLVDDIYAAWQKLMDAGVTIHRPPRDGHMAFVRSPDGISIELLQRGEALEPAEPWASMENTGTW